MSNNTIITISRQYGSGGHAIARELSKLMGIKMYDGELLDLVAKDTGLSEEILRSYDEKPTNSFLYSLSLGAFAMDNTMASPPNMPMEDRVFSAQADMITSIAEKESAIFVGRCANSILKDNPNLISVFIHTDYERRIKRIAEYEKITNNAAADIIKKADKRRASYNNYFSDLKWGDASTYDLCINSRVGFNKAAQLIKFFAENKNK